MRRALILLALFSLSLGASAMPAVSAGEAGSVAEISTEGQCLQLPEDGSRCPAWGHAWLNPGGDNAACAANNVPQNEVAGPTGVYVTGWACDAQDKPNGSGGWIPGNDIFTLAYDLDGSIRWVARYNGPGGAQDAIGDDGRGIALSPSGDRLYVTGGQNQGLGGTETEFRFVGDFVTIAYDTATGAELWTASYHGPAVGLDMAEQVAVSEDGERVYVVGESHAADLADGSSGGSDATVISYIAATGERDWVSRYHVPGSNRNNAVGTTSISVRGTRIYTSGTYGLGAPTFGSGYEILAIEDDREEHRGVQVWTAISDPGIAFRPARGAFAATDNGIFLAGTRASQVAPPATCPPQQTSGAANAEYGTVGLDPETGAIRWSKSYSGQTGGNNGAFGLATDSTGSRVFVTGQASGPAPQCAVAIATVAYDGATGDQVWSDYQPPLAGTSPQGFAIAAARDGSRVYVAGLEYHLTTLGYRGDSRVLAYDATGGLRWSGRYNSAPVGSALDLDSFAYFLRLSPDGGRLYLTTMVNRRDQVTRSNRQLYGTVAYDTVSPAADPAPEAACVPTVACVGLVGTEEATGVAAGAYHTCALLETGNVRCWGDDQYGQANSYAAGDVVAVSGGALHSCALRSNGNVRCWGDPYYSSAIDGYSGGDAVSVDSAGFNSCALLSSGNVRCWGFDPEDDPRHLDVDNLYDGGDAIAASAGMENACALLESGNVDCWAVVRHDPGNPDYGQSADYTGGDAVAVDSGGLHNCAVLSNGNIECWGWNDLSQAADYTGGDAVAVGAGEIHTCALLETGNVRCWGYDTAGELAPYDGGDAVELIVGNRHNCVLLESGNVHCWGLNDFGQSLPYMKVPPDTPF